MKQLNLFALLILLTSCQPREYTRNDHIDWIGCEEIVSEETNDKYYFLATELGYPPVRWEAEISSTFKDTFWYAYTFRPAYNLQTENTTIIIRSEGLTPENAADILLKEIVQLDIPGQSWCANPHGFDTIQHNR